MPAYENQALTAPRHFVDGLRHVLALNPFASVRRAGHSVAGRVTPEITIEQARKLLRSVDVGHVVSLRNRATLGVPAYTGARVGAVTGLHRGDLRIAI